MTMKKIDVAEIEVGRRGAMRGCKRFGAAFSATSAAIKSVAACAGAPWATARFHLIRYLSQSAKNRHSREGGNPVTAVEACVAAGSPPSRG